MASRYVIEGEWSGYTSGQRRVCHRVVTSRDALADWVRRNHAIYFTDGTALYLTVRPAAFREKVKEIHGYDSLISDCMLFDVNSVDAVIKAQKAAKEATR